MNTARSICEFLSKQGCTSLFGIPGYANSLLFLETRHVAGIEPVLAKHEEGAAWMAYGYAQATGGFGACTGTSGPGTTNLITGVVAAYMNSVPLLVLTGQVERSKFGRGGFQELSGQGPRSVDVMRLFDTMTKFNAQLSDASELPSVLANALDALTHGRKGPVHLNIPVDVLRAEVPFAGAWNAPRAAAWATASPDALHPGAEGAAVSELASLRQARAPLFLFGKGCHEVRERARAVVRALGIPAATTLQGKGILDSELALSFGIVGIAGSPRANAYIREACDFVIAVGTSLGEFTLDGFSDRGVMSKTLLRVDIDAREFVKAPFASKNFLVDAGAFFDALLAAEERECGRAGGAGSESRSAWEFHATLPLVKEVARVHDRAGAVAPMDVIDVLEAVCTDDTVFVADSGNAAVWAAHYLRLKPTQQFHIDINLASMGSGLLSSLGHALAPSPRRVVCIAGDGAFLMNGVEVSTAADLGLDVVWVVLNDGKLGMVVQGDSARYGATVASCFTNHDIARLAQACGARAIRVTSMEELRNAFSSDNETGRPRGPLVIDVVVNDAYLPQVYSRSQRPVAQSEGAREEANAK